MSAGSRLGENDRFRILRDALSNISLILGIIIVLAIVVVVLFGPLLAPYNPYLVDRVVIDHFDFERDEYIRVPVNPEPDFPLGTNEVGQDMLSLILHGARNTLIAGVLIATARVLIGLFVGLIAGWFEGKWFDRLTSAIMSVLTSLPMLIGGILLIFAIGLAGGMWTFFFALTVIGWTEVAQYIRGEVLVARRMPYMEAARSIGLREIEIAIRHVMPNIIPQLFVISFLEVGAVLMLLGELALIGVFIGGGATLDFSDVMSPPNVIAIPNTPEWGAMIASGFLWLRSNPHIVMVPASAVFIAVLGFNAVGEGLRGLFERRGIKTSFLLSKRMVLLLAMVFLAAFAIFQSTQPAQWFEAMAENFDSRNVQLDREIIQNLAAQSTGWDRPIPIAEYVAMELDEYGARGAVRWANFFDVRLFYVYEPAWTPVLEIMSSDGQQVEQQFEYGSDFGYIIDEYGGPGNITRPLSALHFYPDLRIDDFQSFQRLSFDGKIVMLEEGNAPARVGQAVADQGASAIIWVAEPGAALQDARMKAIPEDAEYDDELGIPVFRVSYNLAEQILASQELTFANIFESPEETEIESSWEIAEASIQLRMQLGLKDKKQVEINNVVAYFQGTDAGMGDEIIVFVLPCDGLWRSEETIEAPQAYQPRECSAPLVIEFARMLNEQVIDIKRPIMVLLWGGGEFSHLGLNEWLSNRDDNFAHLSAPGMSLQPQPRIIFQIVDQPNSTQIQIEDLSAENAIGELLEGTFEWASAPLNKADGLAQIPLWVSNDFLKFQANISIDFSNPDFQAYGEGLSLALVRMLREQILNAR